MCLCVCNDLLLAKLGVMTSPPPPPDLLSPLYLPSHTYLIVGAIALLLVLLLACKDCCMPRQVKTSALIIEKVEIVKQPVPVPVRMA